MYIGPFKFNLTEEGKLFQKENKINGQHYGERSRVVMKGEFIYFMLLSISFSEAFNEKSILILVLQIKLIKSC